MKKYIFIFLLSFLFLSDVHLVLGEHGEVYQKNGQDYVEINNVTYGPYEEIDYKGVLEKGDNWAFKHYKNHSGYKPSFATYEIYFVVNNTEYGPYHVRTDDLNNYDLYLSKNTFGFTFPKHTGGVYVRLGEDEIGPCQSVSRMKITDNNYGFDCFAYFGKDNYFYINGKKHIADNQTASSLKLTLNHWGYSYSDNDDKYAVINEDTFGPFDKLNDFKINDENWAIIYEKDGSYFVLSDNNEPYKLPLTKEQAENDIHGLFSDLFYTGGQQCHDMGCYAYKNKLRLEDEYWYLKYNIDEKEYEFTNKPKEEIKITNSKLFTKIKGKIIIKVEDMGKAYYVNPSSETMHYLGKPDDAFNVMREQGIGISEKDFNSFDNYAPRRLSGSILLRVEANGEAYYVNPLDSKMHYLGRPNDAFQVMRNLGLGISNSDFDSMQ